MESSLIELIERACHLARSPKQRAELALYIRETVLPSLEQTPQANNNGHVTLADMLKSALPVEEIRRRVAEASPKSTP